MRDVWESWEMWHLHKWRRVLDLLKSLYHWTWYFHCVFCCILLLPFVVNKAYHIYAMQHRFCNGTRFCDSIPESGSGIRLLSLCRGNKKVKVKFSHTRYRALGPELIPVYRQSARRWLFKSSPAVGCHYFPPGLRSPSQPKNITVLRPVPSYTTVLGDRHRGVNNLLKAVTQLCPDGNWTHDLLIASQTPFPGYLYATASWA